MNFFLTEQRKKARVELSHVVVSGIPLGHLGFAVHKQPLIKKGYAP
jgi:hypothetical protein